MSRIRFVIALCLVVSLSGCLGLGGETEPARVFTLAVRDSATVDVPVDAQLMIAEPRAGQTLDSDRIAVRPSANELQYYAGAAWRDRAPRLVQDAVIEAFEQTGAFRAVGRNGGGLRGDFTLLLELRHFEAVYRNGRPQVEIALQATLLGEGGEALASRRFGADAVAADKEVPAVVDAFGVATSQVVGELVAWAHQAAGK